MQKSDLVRNLDPNQFCLRCKRSTTILVPVGFFFSFSFSEPINHIWSNCSTQVLITLAKKPQTFLSASEETATKYQNHTGTVLGFSWFQEFHWFWSYREAMKPDSIFWRALWDQNITLQKRQLFFFPLEGTNPMIVWHNDHTLKLHTNTQTSSARNNKTFFSLPFCL